MVCEIYSTCTVLDVRVRLRETGFLLQFDIRFAYYICKKAFDPKVNGVGKRIYLFYLAQVHHRFCRPKHTAGVGWRIIKTPFSRPLMFASS